MTESDPYSRRGYRGTSYPRPSTISTGLAQGAQLFTAVDLSTWAGSTANGPISVEVSYDTAANEVIEIGTLVGNAASLITRGLRGTTDHDHPANCKIRICHTDRDFAESNAHIADTTLDHHSLYVTRKGTRAPAFDVKAYGAVGDGVTNDTAAILAAIAACAAAGGGIVLFPPGTYLISASIVVPNGVILRGTGITILTSDPADVAACVLKAAAGMAVPMVDLSDTLRAGVEYLAFRGVNTSGCKGIYGTNVNGARLQHLTLDNFADQAIHLGGVAAWIDDIFIQNAVLNRTRVAYIGALDLDVTDVMVTKVEATASVTDAEGIGSGFIAAIASRGANGFFGQCVAEIAELGFYCASELTTYVDCRADLNQGDGFRVVGSQNELIGCLAYSNSRDGNGLYDGFINVGQQNTFVACRSSSSGDGLAHRYGFRDIQSTGVAETGAAYYGCRSTLHTIAEFLNTSGLGGWLAFDAELLNLASTSSKLGIAGETFLSRLAADNWLIHGILRLQAAGEFGTVMLSGVTGEAGPRFRMRGGGELAWGPNTGAYDVSINRTDTAAVGTPNKWYVGGEIEIDGALNHDGTTAGVFGVTPTTRPSAFTQTYSTSSKTVAAPTAANPAAITAATPATTAATVTTADGSDPATTQTLANALKVELNKLITDVAGMKAELVKAITDVTAVRAETVKLVTDQANDKQNLTAVIDDLQSTGWLQ